MAVTVLVDAPARQLAYALDAVRDTPAPVGGQASRVAVLARAAAELQGVYLRELAATSLAEAGCRDAASLLVEHAGLPVWQARADAALAARLSAVPGLLDALAGGSVELAAARLLARAWSALPSRLRDPQTAQALIVLGGLVDLASLRAKVDELVAALAPDVTDADLADARESGELTLVRVGAQVRLSGHTDALQGEWLQQVLAAKAEADRGLADGRTTGQRLLDALLDCVRAAVDGGAVPLTDGVPPQLVVVTTVDDLLRAQDDAAVAVGPEEALDDLLAGVVPSPTAPRGPRWTSCTRGGVPVGPRTLAGVCCTAVVSRLVLGTPAHPVDATPERRQLNRAERRALEHRAGYRCERRGCGRAAYLCVPHHVDPWALGGPSTLANTVLLCRACHHLLHDRERDLRLVDGRTIGPRGLVDDGPGPPDPF